MKKTMRIFLFTIFFMRLVFAQNYYVDQNNASASDSNPGTEALPFKTIQAGVNAALAGDTVIIKGSTLSGSVQAIYDVSGNGITTKRNGSSWKYIVVEAYPGDAVIVKGNGTGDGIEINNSYHEFYGIVFTNFNKATECLKSKKIGIIIEDCEFSYTKETGLRLRYIDSLIIRNTYVHNCFEAGIAITRSHHGLLENVISNNNSDSLGSNGDGDGFRTEDVSDSIDFINCTAIGNSEDGFDINTSGNMINCISANQTACNVKLWRRDDDNYANKTMNIINMINYKAGEAGIKITYGPEMHLFNSVIYNNGEEGVAFRGVSVTQGPDTVVSFIVNNIIAGNGDNGIDVRQSGPNSNKIIADHNLYYENTYENNGLFSDDNFISRDPQFVDADNYDFHLQQTSPAINKGITEEIYNSLYSSLGVDISKDFDGNTRPKYGVWDIGAYETDVANGVQQSVEEIPSSYFLQNYPNPFNPSTKIQFEFPKSSNVKMEIFNAVGRKIVTLVDNFLSAGLYTELWNGKDSQNKDVASGVYYYRLIVGNHVLVRKMVLIR